MIGGALFWMALLVWELEMLYRCETWSLTLRDEYRLRVFHNRVLRKIFGHMMVKVIGGGNGEDCIKSFMICMYNQILLRCSDQEE
jgi:hypothetical protein